MVAFGGRHRKANQTGRTDGYTNSVKKLLAPPKDQPWTWLNRDLLQSSAWRAMGINARKLMDFLLLDHMANAGVENGALCATYEQLVDFGLTRSEISRAIDDLENLGLVSCQRGGRWNFTNQPSRFRLTFYTDKDGNPATQDWKRHTDETVAELRRRRRKQNSMSKSRTTVVREVEPRAKDGGCYKK